MLKLDRDPIRLDNESYVIKIGDDKVKYPGQKLNESPQLNLPKDEVEVVGSFDPFAKPVEYKKEDTIPMSDSLNLTGPDANMERETFLEEQKRSEAMDSTKINALLRKTFCDPPVKTIDEMSDDEILKHKYTLEETVRLLRVHILTTNRNVEKRRAKSGKKVFDGLDATYKPKPIPASRQATNAYDKLKQTLMEEMDITEEAAVAILKMKGKK